VRASCSQRTPHFCVDALRLTPFPPSPLLPPGGVDLLLHLLKNIADLPVWTSVVKTSGLGKAIGSIEKNRICSGSPNEGPIKERVALVKDHWKASVKARKIIDPQSKVGEKREPPVVPTEAASPAAKRTKVSESPKSSYFSSLVKKASGGESLASMSSAKANPSTTNGTKVATKSTPANPGRFRRVKV
jgi:hypothetical protein